MDFGNVTFNTVSVFGKAFVPNRQTAICSIGDMLNSGMLKIDGSIPTTNIGKISKNQIWSYVYYLWSYNRSRLDIFHNMSSYEHRKTKASPVKFCEELYYFMKKNDINVSGKLKSIFKKENIVFCINKILMKHPNISIPILQKIYKKILNATNSQTSSLFNRNSNNFTSSPTIELKANNIQIKANDNYNVERVEKSNGEANVKIQFGVNLVPKK